MNTIGFTVAIDTLEISENDNYLALELERIGYRVIPLHWQKKLPYTHDLVVLFRSHWNYHYYYQDFIDWLRYLKWNKIPTINSIELIGWNSRKEYLIDLSKKGVHIPRTKKPETKNIDIQDLQLFNTKEIVVKPMVGASGEGVIKLPKSELPTWWNEKPLEERSRGWIFQEFEEGIVDGELSLIFFNGQYSHTIKKIPQKNEFRVNTQFHGKLQRIEPEGWIINEAKKILSCLNEMPVYARVDMVINRQGEAILFELEINEPSLYFSLAPEKARNLAEVIHNKIMGFKTQE